MKIKHLLYIPIIILSFFIINKAFAEYNYTNTYYNNEQNIYVAQPIPLSYKSKQEIYNIRKNAVKKSIFNYDYYEPSNEVFGQIEDGKPWISMNCCILKDNPRSNIAGASEEARFILNPTALVQINFPFSLWCKQGQYKPYIHLKSIKYIKDKKEIIVTYEKLNQDTLSNNSYFSFCGINARDLGYKYAYVDSQKTTYNLQFVNSSNISNHIVEFQDFLHTGISCKHEGGCNNGSPAQPMLDFENSHRANSPYEYNKEIYIKLWKNKPISPNEKPDIVERIIIEKA